MTDVIIIGGGPAGLSCALYAKRAGLSAMIIDKGPAECQLTKAVEIENYLGFTSISGIDLYSKFQEHVKAQNIQIVKKAVIAVEKMSEGFKVSTKKDTYESKYLIIATGRSHKHLGIDGEDALVGAGVSYCATCDGYFFKDKTICIVGGGDSALTQALFLSSICQKVYLIHRRNTFKAANYLVERVSKNNKVELVLNANVSEILADTSVKGLRIGYNGTSRDIECDGVFIAIGEQPNMKFSVEGLEVTSNGQIKTDNYCKTNIDGLYAVGDIRDREVYQVITAVADGALAIEGILKDLARNK